LIGFCIGSIYFTFVKKDSHLFLPVPVNWRGTAGRNTAAVKLRSLPPCFFAHAQLSKNAISLIKPGRKSLHQ
jgi:hypothetical protein